MLARRPLEAVRTSYFPQGSPVTLSSPNHNRLQIIRAVYRGREVTIQVRGIATSTELVLPIDVGGALGIEGDSKSDMLAVTYRFIPSPPTTVSHTPSILSGAFGAVAVADADVLRAAVEEVETSGPHLYGSDWSAGYFSQVQSVNITSIPLCFEFRLVFPESLDAIRFWQIQYCFNVAQYF